MMKVLARGFTLVELMVVVAIIGVLAAVAIPSFKKYTYKSRTTEAKLHLSALYVAMQNIYTNFNTYASCPALFGYIHSGGYYGGGIFSVPLGNPSWGDLYMVNNGQPTCDGSVDWGMRIFDATQNVATNDLANTQCDFYINDYGGGGSFTQSTFSAQMAGIIRPLNFNCPDLVVPGVVDAWNINQAKSLTHQLVGY
jgi:prepilin-type N-terminal cleavage/methylation domain-containing protein